MSVRRERTVDAEGEARSAWQKVEGAPQEITLDSGGVARVEVRTDRVKGGLLGTLAGIVVGGGIGTGVGFAVAPAKQTCPTPGLPPGFPDPNCRSPAIQDSRESP